MRASRLSWFGTLLASATLAIAGCGGSSGPSGPTCKAPTPTQCGMGTSAFCTDLQTDPANCGKCGTACPATAPLCKAGVCSACAMGQTTCGSGATAVCTDTTSDPKNCGKCGTVCPTTAPMCSNGICGSCNLLTNTGCPSGMKCTVGQDPMTNNLVYACVSAGTQTAGQTCMVSASGDNCVAGDVCLGTGGTTGTCYAFCGTCDPYAPATVDPCPKPMTAMYCMPTGTSPTYCINVVTDGKTPPDYLALICASSCDIYSGASCTYQTSTGAMMSGGNCFLIPGGPVCDAPGTVATGSACTHYNDCASGDSCFQVGSNFMCEPNCDKTKTPSTCPSGTTCHDAMDPDIPNLGYCM